MLERQYQTLFNRWVQNEFKGTAVFELKRCQTILPFDSVKEHQENALFQTKHNKVVYKLPDLGNQNPFDSFCIEKCEAYVVIFFENLYKGLPRGSSWEFVMIDIDAWIEAKKNSKRKSINSEEAKKIGIIRALKRVMK